MQQNPQQIYDFVIIGAGLSGLQSALILSQNNKNFIILQASQKIGGRVGTQSIHQIIQNQELMPSLGWKQKIPSWMKQNNKILDIKIDYGATWIAQYHKYILKLAQQFKIKYYQQFRQGSFLYGKQPGQYQTLKQFHHYYNQQKLQKINNFLKQIHKLQKQFQFLYKQAKQLKDEAKTKQYKQFINKYDSMSVQKYLYQNINDKQICQQIMNFIQCLQCISCNKFSVMQLINENGMVLQNVYLGVGKLQYSDDEYRAKQGMIEFANKFYEKIINNMRINKQNFKQQNILKLNDPVIKIQGWRNNKQLCKVYTKNNKIYHTKRVLNSIPLGTLKNIEIQQQSKGKTLFRNGQIQGNVNRMFMIFKQPFWRQTFHGYCLFSNKFPFNQITQLSPQNLSCGIFAIVFYADKYQKWIKQNPNQQQRQKYIKKTIADMFLKGNINSQHLLEYYSYMRTFQQHQYIKAAYQSASRINLWKQIQQNGQQYNQCFHKDQNGIYYIGSQFSIQCANFMQGAIRNSRKKVYGLLNINDPWRL